MEASVISGEKGFYINGVLHYTPSETYDLCKNSDAVILDVRAETMNGYKRFGIS